MTFPVVHFAQEVHTFFLHPNAPDVKVIITEPWPTARHTFLGYVTHLHCCRECIGHGFWWTPLRGPMVRSSPLGCCRDHQPPPQSTQLRPDVTTYQHRLNRSSMDPPAPTSKTCTMPGWRIPQVCIRWVLCWKRNLVSLSQVGYKFKRM